MAKDHFQDIIPPGDLERQGGNGMKNLPSVEDHNNDDDSITVASSDKSIRNISITRKAAQADGGRSAPQRSGSRLWLWALAAICFLIAGLLVVLYVFRQTSITVVPHSQPVVFDKTLQFTAYPETSAATGTLSYSVKTTDLNDAEPVVASGTTHKETKASGSITVFNSYSDNPVQLLKNTRFQSSSGLIFRAPIAVSVPGRQGSTPGKVTITVQADAAGPQYNISASEKLTLPGLKDTADMYSGVYAQTTGLSGGFSGDAPNIPDAALAAAKSTIEGRLQKQAQDFASTLGAGSIALTPSITFTEAAPTSATGTIQLHETAHVVIPVISTDELAGAIAQTVAANAATIRYAFVPGKDFAATAVDSTAQAGSDPLTFAMSGTGTLVAQVDKNALAEALAGRDSAAFQSIVANFPGVDSAHARIEPFWENTFPKNPTLIKIQIQGVGTQS
jgi:hypothetical protein